MIDEDIGDQIKEEVDAIEETRVLFGLLNRPQAESWYKRHYSVRNRAGDHLADTEWEKIWTEELTDDFVEIYTDVSTGGSPDVDFQDSNVELEDLPDTGEVQNHIEQFKASNYFQDSFANVDESDWSIKLVPIKSLVAWQPHVATSAYRDVPTSDDSWKEVLEYCLPFEVTNYLMSEVRQSRGEGGEVQFVSRSPNVNILGPNVEEIRKMPDGNVSVQFQIRTRPNFVQVEHCDGRYFLKNGYHRSFQLMQNGEEYIPAVVLEVEGFKRTAAAGAGWFSDEKLNGERPPLVADFDSKVAVNLEQKGRNTVIRIEGKKFSVER